MSQRDEATIVLFHRDLRVDDHPALAAAAERGKPIVCAYIEDQAAAGPRAPGGASRWWLHHSLSALSDSLAERGASLVLRRGNTICVLRDLVTQSNAGAIYFSRGYEPWVVERERAIHQAFSSPGTQVRRFAGRLLADPDRVRTKSGDVYKVYTPFWRALRGEAIRPPAQTPASLPGIGTLESERLEDWGFLPTQPNWAQGFEPEWTPGERGAHDRLTRFLRDHVANYQAARDRPDQDATSRLSPHLHFGELSPAQCWRAAMPYLETEASAEGAEIFAKELVWREFSYHLLYHFPHIPQAPLYPKFSAMPWRDDPCALRAWQQGRTGIPIIDAGMRQLWQTGWMHNRVRMIVASFLTKNLLVDWRCGEAWFWDCLVDADLASNAAQWQWVAGSGADAAPYFRIFNPVTQSQKFDPNGDYIRRFVHELSNVPPKDIHAPWQGKSAAAKAAMTDGYPEPVVDLKQTRQRALDAYDTVKSAAQ